MISVLKSRGWKSGRASFATFVPTMLKVVILKSSHTWPVIGLTEWQILLINEMEKIRTPRRHLAKVIACMNCI
jgi:hypothetical protein